MRSNEVPVKTADGQAELAQRVRGLGQRHRTLLLLVDGRRTVHQVLQMATAAGVPPEVLDELVALGLVRSVSAGDSRPMPLSAPEDSWLPAAQSLLPESEQGAFDEAPLDPMPDQLVDGPLEQARGLLLKALRSEAPVAGSLTIMKLKRARTRDEVSSLLAEVEQRLRKPHKQVMAAQLLRQVKYLLSLPSSEP
jgi:hypothetical protein